MNRMVIRQELQRLTELYDELRKAQNNEDEERIVWLLEKIDVLESEVCYETRTA